MINNLETGDIILFSSHEEGWWKYLSNLIKFGTHSEYTHIGMIVRNPTFLHESLNGIFVWESGWEGMKDPQDDKIKLGVQLTPLHEILNNFKNGRIMIRKVITKTDCFSEENLKKVHNEVYNKPYDLNPIDWILALLSKDIRPQKTSCFWCSALVGYIYTKCGILEEKTDWSKLSPNDFSLAGENLNYIEGNYLEKTETRIN
jgi:hypothetical protein